MKVRFFLPFIICLLWLSSCGNRDKNFTVVGEIANMPEQTVYLEELRVKEIIVVDSVSSDKNGKFELSGSATEAGLYRLRFQQSQFVLLSLEKGNTVKVTATWPNVPQYNVTGSPASASLRGFMHSVRGFVSNVETYNIVIDSMRARKNDSLLTKATNAQRDTKEQFTRYIEEYTDTTKYLPNAICAILMLNTAAEREYIGIFMQSLSARFPNSKLAQEYIDQMNHALNNEPNYPTAAEIKLPAPDGKEVSLSSYRGKYVLVDFWASWCQPCRAENPNVVAAYNKFRDKNFDILGVSLDNDKDKWLQAIAKDQLTWTHISDLEGWESIAARDYNIQEIPANFLIDPKGRIIARNLKGPELETKLAEVLK